MWAQIKKLFNQQEITLGTQTFVKVRGKQIANDAIESSHLKASVLKDISSKNTIPANQIDTPLSTHFQTFDRRGYPGAAKLHSAGQVYIHQITLTTPVLIKSVKLRITNLLSIGIKVGAAVYDINGNKLFTTNMNDATTGVLNLPIVNTMSGASLTSEINLYPQPLYVCILITGGDAEVIASEAFSEAGIVPETGTYGSNNATDLPASIDKLSITESVDAQAWIGFYNK